MTLTIYNAEDIPQGSDAWLEARRGIVTASENGELIATTTGDQRSSRLASYIGSNAYLVIQPRETPYNAGEMIQALMVAPPFTQEDN